MIRALLRRLRRVPMVRGRDGELVLQRVKLYRDIRSDGATFRGSDDAPGGTVDYILDLFPPDAFRDASVLDLGSAGGAVCFEAARRACREAIGVEIETRRIRGAWAIQRRLRCRTVRFHQQDLYRYLERRTGEAYDIVFALNILHHFSHPVPLLAKLGRASRDYLCIETPDDARATAFREYGPLLRDIEAADLVTDVPGYFAYLKALHWEIVAERESEHAKLFELANVTRRRVSLLRRRTALPDRATRWREMGLFLEHRSRVREAVLRDPHRLIWADAAQLLDHLRRMAPNTPVNYLLLGPRASGKSHAFDRLPPRHKPRYNPKIFKFPNADGQHGLERHLRPSAHEAERFAEVLVSTSDDPRTHVSLDQLLHTLRGRSVVCLLVYCDAREHFDRLYDREAAAWGTPSEDIWIDLSMRFDYRPWIEAFRRHQIPYVIIHPEKGDRDAFA